MIAELSGKVSGGGENKLPEGLGGLMGPGILPKTRRLTNMKVYRAEGVCKAGMW